MHLFSGMFSELFLILTVGKKKYKRLADDVRQHIVRDEYIHSMFTERVKAKLTEQSKQLWTHVAYNCSLCQSVLI